jgi:oligoribonuclease NrnB/cAMP/cGMP phosphodiesterase (DHH superfamily)
MKCFYHNDLDGKAAAFCVHAWVGIKEGDDGDWQEAHFIPINYDQPFPFETIERGEQIWIVDYSISPDEMRKLLAITPDVTWIDHHKTAIEKYADFETPIRGIRRDGQAGCVLAWKYIHWWTARGEGKEDFSRDESGTLPVPRCILLTGDRDTWTWKYGDETKYFYAGSQLYDTEPDSAFWWHCMAHETQPREGTGNAEAGEKGRRFWEKLLLRGETIEAYKRQFYKELAESIGYEVGFEGCRCLAINVARVSSDVFGELMDDYEILLPHYHAGKMWTVSLYTNQDIDVSKIAVKYGGGGHKQAAGFTYQELPWRPMK